MKKPTIHLGNGPYSSQPCRPGAEVLCGKTAGSTHGVMPTEGLFWLGGSCVLQPESEYSYSVYLTKKGIKCLSLDFREVARDSIKMYGYYNSYRYGNTFKLCKECLESEEFGLLALASV